MRAVRNDETGIHVVERPEPEGDGVLVEIASCGICGTDLGFLAMGPLPFTLGHEFAGTVGGVAYAIEPMTRCGTCEACREGQRQSLHRPEPRELRDLHRRRIGRPCSCGRLLPHAAAQWPVDRRREPRRDDGGCLPRCASGRGATGRARLCRRRRAPSGWPRWASLDTRGSTSTSKHATNTSEPSASDWGQASRRRARRARTTS